MPETPKLPSSLKIRNIADIKGPSNKPELIHFNPDQWRALMKRTVIIENSPELSSHSIKLQLVPLPGADRIMLPVCGEDGQKCWPVRTVSGGTITWSCSCESTADLQDPHLDNGFVLRNSCKFTLTRGVPRCGGTCAGKCKLIFVQAPIPSLACDCKH